MNLNSFFFVRDSACLSVFSRYMCNSKPYFWGHYFERRISSFPPLLSIHLLWIHFSCKHRKGRRRGKERGGRDGSSRQQFSKQASSNNPPLPFFVFGRCFISSSSFLCIYIKYARPTVQRPPRSRDQSQREQERERESRYSTGPGHTQQLIVRTDC